MNMVILDNITLNCKIEIDHSMNFDRDINGNIVKNMPNYLIKFKLYNFEVMPSTLILGNKYKLKNAHILRGYSVLCNTIYKYEIKDKEFTLLDNPYSALQNFKIFTSEREFSILYSPIYDVIITQITTKYILLESINYLKNLK